VEGLTMTDEYSITMADVELAVKILNTFFMQSRKAQLVLKRMGMLEGREQRTPNTMEGWMRYVADSKKQNTDALPEPSEPISAEEQAKMDEIRKKMKESHTAT
jgi:hypothetical protein